MKLPKDISVPCREFLTACFNKDSKLRPDTLALLETKWITNGTRFIKPEDMGDSDTI
jgi:hypothetical protein